MQRGLIHIHCGDGKGKTTAALGLILRAVGDGRRAVLVQFLKGGGTGELAALRTLGVPVLRGKPGSGFAPSMDARQRSDARALHDAHLRQAIALAQSGDCDLLVLDEVMAALRHRLLDEALLRDFVAHKPDALELVLTGRNPPDCLIACADCITEMQKRRHPYDAGVPAREGIEF